MLNKHNKISNDETANIVDRAEVWKSEPSPAQLEQLDKKREYYRRAVGGMALNVAELRERIKQVVPETLYRAERVYLGNVIGNSTETGDIKPAINIDQLGTRTMTTTDIKNIHNNDGLISMAPRDDEFIESYAIGNDGRPMYYRQDIDYIPKEEIPIGVIYKIHNPDNILGAVPEGDPLPSFIPSDLAGKHREFVASSVPPMTEINGKKVGYEVIKLHIMDDYINQKYSSTAQRQILETINVSSPDELPAAIAKVKTRIDELDTVRRIG